MGYVLRIWLLYCGVIPFSFSIMTLVLLSANLSLAVIAVTLMLVSGGAAGVLAAMDRHLPEHFGKRYVPVVFPLGYTVVLWAVCMLSSGGFYGSSIWGVHTLLQIPFLPISFMTSFEGVGILYLLAPLSYYSAFLLGYFFKERTRQPRIVVHRKQLVSVAIVIVIAGGIGSLVQWQRSQTVRETYLPS